MKKLYENIEDIHIVGDIGHLSELVTDMDRIIQSIADETDKIVVVLCKYNSSNQGKQYERVVQSTVSLRNSVFKYAKDLNEMQNQIVKYQNKIYRYEDIARSAATPNLFYVSTRQISVDSAIMKFNRNDMTALASALKNYREKIFNQTRMILEKKNAIGSIWRDSQYRMFSNYVDDIARDIAKAIEVFDEFIRYLEEKIKELN